ncbi:MAG: DUF2889 domain-containing protein [Deltaproteobacteria bacterium]|nr:DUF2889 domain-containing protein [Deltaproteobacteria bacterium]
MASLKDLIKGAPVHERKLTLHSYPLEDGRLIIEGWLRDERLVDGYHWNGVPRDPGVVHWMCIRFLVGDWPLTILDAEGEMPDVPHKLCPSTLEGIKRVVGLKIVAGYSDKVRGIFGGVLGCSHLTHLMMVMGAAALHGYWTQHSRERQPIPRSLAEFESLPQLIDSCALWDKDGPIMKDLKASIEASGKTP